MQAVPAPALNFLKVRGLKRQSRYFNTHAHRAQSITIEETEAKGYGVLRVVDILSYHVR